MPHPARERLLQAAMERHRAGDVPAAATIYRQLLGANPADADALNLLGVALHQEGRTDAAIECLQAAVKARRKDASIHYNLGTVLIDAGRYAEAESALRAALKLGGRDPHLEMNLANALALQGKAQAALPFFRVACKRAAGSVAVWLNYGNALRDTDALEQALAAYGKALELNPDDIAARASRGQLLHRMERLDEAEADYRRVMSAGACDAGIVASLAQVLLHRARYDEARRLANRTLELDSTHLVALLVLGDVCRRLHDYPAAEAALRRALELQPDCHDAAMKLANVVFEAGRPEEALEILQRSDAPAEYLFGIALGKATAHLALGEYSAGWTGLQMRGQRENIVRAEPDVPWTQSVLPTELCGKTVFVRREQGLGDEILYLRWLPELRARGARVLYRCGEKLEPLLLRAQIADRIGADLQPPTDADHYLAAGDLPWALEAGIRAPGVAGSLRFEPLPERVAALRERLARAGAPPYIGLTWRAGTPPERQQGVKGRVLWKEIAPAALGDAIRPVNGTLIAMQRNPIDGEIHELSAACGRSVHDFNAWNEDLDDALALLAGLDDYIGVSSTNMHLVAALGRTARVLLPFPPDWRWFSRDAESPFFPGFRLYRQAIDGSWQAALEQLRAELIAHFGTR